MTISEISSRFQLKIICRRNIFWLSKTKYIVRATMHVITCICKIQPRCPRDHIVNFMSCNTVKTCACLIQGKIFDGIIEIQLTRYLEFDGAMDKIRVNRSLIQEELRKYGKSSLFNDERETTRAKF